MKKTIRGKIKPSKPTAATPIKLRKRREADAVTDIASTGITNGEALRRARPEVPLSSKTIVALIHPVSENSDLDLVPGFAVLGEDDVLIDAFLDLELLCRSVRLPPDGRRLLERLKPRERLTLHTAGTRIRAIGRDVHLSPRQILGEIDEDIASVANRFLAEWNAPPSPGDDRRRYLATLDLLSHVSDYATTEARGRGPYREQMASIARIVNSAVRAHLLAQDDSIKELDSASKKVLARDSGVWPGVTFAVRGGDVVQPEHVQLEQLRDEIASVLSAVGLENLDYAVHKVAYALDEGLTRTSVYHETPIAKGIATLSGPWPPDDERVAVRDVLRREEMRRFTLVTKRALLDRSGVDSFRFTAAQLLKAALRALGMPSARVKKLVEPERKRLERAAAQGGREG